MDLASHYKGEEKAIRKTVIVEKDQISVHAPSFAHGRSRKLSPEWSDFATPKKECPWAEVGGLMPRDNQRTESMA